jgi:predicted SprT family Zn-dependent metalloprotease
LARHNDTFDELAYILYGQLIHMMARLRKAILPEAGDGNASNNEIPAEGILLRGQKTPKTVPKPTNRLILKETEKRDPKLVSTAKKKRALKPLDWDASFTVEIEPTSAEKKNAKARIVRQNSVLRHDISVRVMETKNPQAEVKERSGRVQREGRKNNPESKAFRSRQAVAEVEEEEEEEADIIESSWCGSESDSGSDSDTANLEDIFRTVKTSRIKTKPNPIVQKQLSAKSTILNPKADKVEDPLILPKTIRVKTESSSRKLFRIEDSIDGAESKTPTNMTADPFHPRELLGMQLKAESLLSLVGTEMNHGPVSLSPPPQKQHLSSKLIRSAEIIDLTSSPTRAPVPSRPGTSDSNDNHAILRFSPPHISRPLKLSTAQRPVTPPLSPLKGRLVSPSKTKQRVPTPPQNRPSLDAFWAPDVVNDWVDRHSPQKILQSPRKERKLERLALGVCNRNSDLNDPFGSPTASPRKSSPQKQTKNARKAFETRKQAIAQEFLAELDEKITDGKIGLMSQSTGGIKLIWTKKLNSTAGRANWRREGIRLRNADADNVADQVTTTYRHHASIELAEKVIDDDERLLNVIAHEFCHLANFMVSGIRDRPHGREFREWGAKVSKLFGHRGVKVTTKHSYEIDYKYIWTCLECAQEYKRHSKSIDPKKHKCGICKSELVQTKPLPRKGDGALTDYQCFVKENFQKIKTANAAASHSEIMEIVGKMYREQKNSDRDNVTQSSQALDEMMDKLKLDP